jgi:hypothetical protein
LKTLFQTLFQRPNSFSGQPKRASTYRRLSKPETEIEQGNDADGRAVLTSHPRAVRRRVRRLAKISDRVALPGADDVSPPYSPDLNPIEKAFAKALPREDADTSPAPTGRAAMSAIGS